VVAVLHRVRFWKPAKEPILTLKNGETEFGGGLLLHRTGKAKSSCAPSTHLQAVLQTVPRAVPAHCHPLAAARTTARSLQQPDPFPFVRCWQADTSGQAEQFNSDLLRFYYARLFPYSPYYNWLSYGYGTV
jgi:hypothetical protein